jgi:hypothetical protein
MNIDRDPMLQEFFMDASQELEGEDFTSQVLARTRSFKLRIVAALAGILLGVFAFAWFFSVPLQEFALMLAKGLTASLIDFGDSWLGWAMAPINTIGGLLLISVKLVRVFWKKISGVFYVN